MRQVPQLPESTHLALVRVKFWSIPLPLNRLNDVIHISTAPHNIQAVFYLLMIPKLAYKTYIGPQLSNLDFQEIIFIGHECNWHYNQYISCLEGDKINIEQKSFTLPQTKCPFLLHLWSVGLQVESARKNHLWESLPRHLLVQYHWKYSSKLGSQ